MALSAAVLVEFELLPDVEVSELVEVLESDELELEVLESEVLVEDRGEEDALELTACSELALLASESSPAGLLLAHQLRTGRTAGSAQD